MRVLTPDVEARRMRLAVEAADFTAEQAALLGVLGSRRLGWDELLDLARSGASPSRRLREALGALANRSIVAVGDDGKLSVSDPAKWLYEVAFERIEASVGTRCLRIAPGTEDGPLRDPGRGRRGGSARYVGTPRRAKV